MSEERQNVIEPTEDQPYTWDVDALIERFGGPLGVVQYVRKQGFKPPSRATVSMWRTRQRIPADWIAALLWWGMHDGVVRDVGAYIVVPADIENPFS